MNVPDTFRQKHHIPLAIRTQYVHGLAVLKLGKGPVVKTGSRSHVKSCSVCGDGSDLSRFCFFILRRSVTHAAHKGQNSIHKGVKVDAGEVDPFKKRKVFLRDLKLCIRRSFGGFGAVGDGRFLIFCAAVACEGGHRKSGGTHHHRQKTSQKSKHSFTLHRRYPPFPRSRLRCLPPSYPRAA